MEGTSEQRLCCHCSQPALPADRPPLPQLVPTSRRLRPSCLRATVPAQGGGVAPTHSIVHDVRKGEVERPAEERRQGPAVCEPQPEVNGAGGRGGLGNGEAHAAQQGNHLRQGRAGQGRAGQGRAGQGRAGQGRAGQGRAGQGRAGQGRAGQGRAGQSVSHTAHRAVDM